jgi:hypothetical protein
MSSVVESASRRVWASPSTTKLDGELVGEQTLAFAVAAGQAKPIRYHAPAMNTHVERFIGTLKRECLDWVIALICPPSGQGRHHRRNAPRAQPHTRHTRPGFSGNPVQCRPTPTACQRAESEAGGRRERWRFWTS